MEVKKLKKVAEIQIRYSSKVKKEERYQIRSSADAYNVLLKLYDQDLIEYQEMFYVLFLNRANEVIGYRQVTKGGVSGTVVDKKQILGIACKANASSIILSHNHPSENLRPSQADTELTKAIVEGGKCLDVLVLDHIIITPSNGYYSMADEGLI